MGLGTGVWPTCMIRLVVLTRVFRRVRVRVCVPLISVIRCFDSLVRRLDRGVDRAVSTGLPCTAWVRRKCSGATLVIFDR